MAKTRKVRRIATIVFASAIAIGLILVVIFIQDEVAKRSLLHATVDNGDKPGIGFLVHTSRDRPWSIEMYLTDPSFPDDFAKARQFDVIVNSRDSHELAITVSLGGQYKESLRVGSADWRERPVHASATWERGDTWQILLVEE